MAHTMTYESKANYQVPQGYTWDEASKRIEDIRRKAKKSGVSRISKANWDFLKECGMRHCYTMEFFKFEIMMYYRFSHQ